MVIQRIQTLFLLLACALMACFTFMSLGQIQTPDMSLNFTTRGLFVEGISTGGPSGEFASTGFFFALALMATIIPFIAIFLFKNLRLQKTVCIIEILFLVATIIVGAVIGYTSVSGACPGWSSIVIAPFLSIILTVMAYVRIRKDQRLLSSADRLR